MATVSFDIIENHNNSTSNNEDNSVKFFSLKNNNDFATVRILYSNPSEFKIVSLHKIKVNNRTISVNCLREYNDSIDTCPLCKSGNNSQLRFYIPMIQYTEREDKIVKELVIWERPLSYAKKLKSLIDEYGPLNESIFRIVRCGEAGDIKTTYEMLYGRPSLYQSTEYELDGRLNEIAKNFDPVGIMVYKKSDEDMRVYCNTGRFPENSETSSQSVETTNFSSVPENTMKEENAVPTNNRPRRYY